MVIKINVTKEQLEMLKASVEKTNLDTLEVTNPALLLQKMLQREVDTMDVFVDIFLASGEVNLVGDIFEQEEVDDCVKVLE